MKRAKHIRLDLSDKDAVKQVCTSSNCHLHACERKVFTIFVTLLNGGLLLDLQVLKDEKTIEHKITHIFHLAFAG